MILRVNQTDPETPAVHLLDSPFMATLVIRKRLPDVRDLTRPDVYRHLLHWSTLGLRKNLIWRGSKCFCPKNG